jgi:adenylate cyclase
LNEYLTPMTEIVIQTDGTLDKYIGDALMAFWGAPVPRTDHAARSCLAALQMMETLEKVLKPKWRAEGKPDIDIGIGLNSGLMRVGFMGSERMRSYTVLGDNVNLGSRLEGTNKNYGTNIIVSASTYDAAKHAVYGRELDGVRVKGKHEPVKIYELVGKGAPTAHDKAWITKFEEALLLYRTKRFDEACAMFELVRTMRGGSDAPSEVYLDRCAHFKDEPPPPNWDGVYDFKTK